VTAETDLALQALEANHRREHAAHGRRQPHRPQDRTPASPGAPAHERGRSGPDRHEGRTGAAARALSRGRESDRHAQPPRRGRAGPYRPGGVGGHRTRRRTQGRHGTPIPKACDEILDEAGSLLRRAAEAETAKRALRENLAARTALCERVESLDDTAARVPSVTRLLLRGTASRPCPATRPATLTGDLTGDQGAAVARRFELACEKATARRELRGAREGVAGEARGGRHRGRGLGCRRTRARREDVGRRSRRAGPRSHRRPQRFPMPSHCGDGSRARASSSRGGSKRAAARRRETQRQNVTRLEALCTRLHDLANAESFDAKSRAARAAEAEAAIADVGPLPPSSGGRNG